MPLHLLAGFVWIAPLDSSDDRAVIVVVARAQLRDAETERQATIDLAEALLHLAHQGPIVSRRSHGEVKLESTVGESDCRPGRKRMKENERLVEFVTNAQTAEAVLGVSTGYAAAAQRLLTTPTK